MSYVLSLPLIDIGYLKPIFKLGEMHVNLIRFQYLLQMLL